MLTVVMLSVYLDIITLLNFAYAVLFLFSYALLAALFISRFETPLSEERLVNLTVHTIPDTPGPWIGLAAWPERWKWALGLAVGWFSLTALGEWFIRIQ